jgi:hypothetical protein
MFRMFTGTTLSKEELQSIEHVVQPLRNARILLQDFYAWDGVYCSQNAKNNNSRCAISCSISYSMWNAELSASQAKSQIKDNVRDSEKEYLTQKEQFLLENPDCNPAIRQSFKILELLQAGTCLWSATSKSSSLRRVCRLHRPTLIRPLTVAQSLEPTFPLPCKGVRHLILGALDVWYTVPPKILGSIREITILLRNIVRRFVNRS